MKTERWDRAAAIEGIRSRIWLYLTPAVQSEELLLDAAALVQLPPEDVLTLANLHFLLSDEVEELLGNLPAIVRRLPSTSAHEEERSTERIRGRVHWSMTLSGRLGSGLPHLYVTTPARRAYQTPEVELLVYVLEAISGASRLIAWAGEAETARVLRERDTKASQWLHHRALADVARRRPTPRTVQRVRNGRHARRFRPVVDAYMVHERLVAQLDPTLLRRVVEERALVTAHDSILFELVTTFTILETLADAGWRLSPLRLFGGGLRLVGKQGHQRIVVWYQQAPPPLVGNSRDSSIQAAHGLTGITPTRPDLVIRIRDGDLGIRWLLVEVKHGTSRSAEASARAAMRDLLAYRRAFDDVLSAAGEPYGLGVAWGSGLESAETEIMLCTPDMIPSAIHRFLKQASDVAPRSAH